MSSENNPRQQPLPDSTRLREQIESGLREQIESGLREQIESGLREQIESGPRDYDWLAFQYLTDELSNPQRAEFENTLSTDPAAAEAFQAMVAVLERLLASGNSDYRSSSNKEKTASSCQQESASANSAVGGFTAALRWVAALAACLLLVVGGLQLFSPKQPTRKTKAATFAISGDQMAEIWASNLEAELLFVSEQAIESEAAEAGRNEAALTAETNEPLEEESSEEDWLYAALVSLDSTEDWPTEGQGGS